jgi:hypothetical protein
MRTDGGGAVNGLLYLLVLACCVRSAGLVAADLSVREERRRRLGALALWLVVALPSLLQIAWPVLLERWERNPDAIQQSGQWWRVLTAGFVQDGGLPGTAFNLIALAIIAFLACRTWGVARTWAVFAVGVVAFNLVATFAWRIQGAGNSAATDLLAASLVGFAATGARALPLLGLTAVTLVDGAVLIALGDGHGIPVVAGPVVGALLGAARGMRPRLAAGPAAVPRGGEPAHGSAES